MVSSDDRLRAVPRDQHLRLDSEGAAEGEGEEAAYDARGRYGFNGMNGLRAGTRKQIRGNVRRLQRDTGAIGAEIGGALDLVAEQVNVLNGEQDFKRAARVHKTISDRWSQRKMDYMTLDLASSSTPPDPTLVVKRI